MLGLRKQIYINISKQCLMFNSRPNKYFVKVKEVLLNREIEILHMKRIGSIKLDLLKWNLN